MSVQLMLQRGLYIRNTFVFKLSGEFCLLDPMDLVTLTDPALGLNKTVVRIFDIEEDSDGALTVTAEEFPQGVATAALYPTQAKSHGVPDSAIAPQPVNTPLILEPPPALTGNVAQLWLGASGRDGDPNWGGCAVWASLDGISYAQIARIGSPARQGVVSAPLPAFSGTNPDSVDTLSVDLTQSGGALSSTSPTSAADGVTLCYVDGEYLSLTTATLAAANKYTLTGLYRGLAGTAAPVHAVGATFCLLDSAILQYDLAASQMGRTIYLKFQSFNIFGSSVQDISTCAVYPYTIQGTGAIGAVGAALALGASMDYGLVSQPVSETDDFGMLSSPVTVIVDLETTTG
jgi:hypothetical protein